jgi:hypothetical protein
MVAHIRCRLVGLLVVFLLFVTVTGCGTCAKATSSTRRESDATVTVSQRLEACRSIGTETTNIGVFEIGCSTLNWALDQDVINEQQFEVIAERLHSVSPEQANGVASRLFSTMASYFTIMNVLYSLGTLIILLAMIFLLVICVSNNQMMLVSGLVSCYAVAFFFVSQRLWNSELLTAAGVTAALWQCLVPVAVLSMQEARSHVQRRSINTDLVMPALYATMIAHAVSRFWCVPHFVASLPGAVAFGLIVSFKYNKRRSDGNYARQREIDTRLLYQGVAMLAIEAVADVTLLDPLSNWPMYSCTSFIVWFALIQNADHEGAFLQGTLIDLLFVLIAMLPQVKHPCLIFFAFWGMCGVFLRHMLVFLNRLFAHGAVVTSTMLRQELYFCMQAKLLIVVFYLLAGVFDNPILPHVCVCALYMQLLRIVPHASHVPGLVRIEIASALVSVATTFGLVTWTIWWNATHTVHPDAWISTSAYADRVLHLGFIDVHSYPLLMWALMLFPITFLKETSLALTDNSTMDKAVALGSSIRVRVLIASAIALGLSWLLPAVLPQSKLGTHIVSELLRATVVAAAGTLVFCSAKIPKFFHISSYRSYSDRKHQQNGLCAVHLPAAATLWAVLHISLALPQTCNYLLYYPACGGFILLQLIADMHPDVAWQLIRLVCNLAMLISATIHGQSIVVVAAIYGIGHYLVYLAHRRFRNTIMFPCILTLMGLGIILAGIQYQQRANEINAFALKLDIFGATPLALFSLVGALLLNIAFVRMDVDMLHCISIAGFRLSVSNANASVQMLNRPEADDLFRVNKIEVRRGDGDKDTGKQHGIVIRFIGDSQDHICDLTNVRAHVVGEKIWQGIRSSTNAPVAFVMAQMHPFGVTEAMLADSHIDQGIIQVNIGTDGEGNNNGYRIGVDTIERIFKEIVTHTNDAPFYVLLVTASPGSLDHAPENSVVMRYRMRPSQILEAVRTTH